ncbi:ThiF family protein [Helicosporidium sp. ATCC 50920]|nr:ThiF family protein [Helicosporidium sp. ATCC 50920]|eukprot:KDD77029.1 ThiF family protein [Helicosporidium sp. ATCC 50920]
MVGAGGIGCELIKTLVLSGFRHIHAVDMDTIETSNLNRQFLFRRHHVGRSKAAVAAEAVLAMRPDVSVVSDQSDITGPHADVDFFRSFSVVLSGLDNLRARRHVNRMCLAAKTPLVESGTAGYLGQVSVHLGEGRTECFECQPKPLPKTFPVCTIRSTPDKPIHCIVWAKEVLFPRLFARQVPGYEEDDDVAEGGAGIETGDVDEHGETGRAHGKASKSSASIYAPLVDETPSQYAARVFDQVFGADVARLEVLARAAWEAGGAPRRALAPLFLDSLAGVRDQVKKAGTRQTRNADERSGSLSARRELDVADAHAVWSVEQAAAVFLLGLELFLSRRAEEVGQLSFDKDDELAMDVVAAAANLRAASFGIPQLSRFEVQGMAGNIVHAIATTNATVAGLIVLEATKIIAAGGETRGNPAGQPTKPSASSPLNATHTTFVRADVSNNKLLTPMASPPPNPTCAVCGKAMLELRVDPDVFTVGDLVEKVLKSQLAMLSPTIEAEDFLYEEGEGLEADEVAFYKLCLRKTLREVPGTNAAYRVLELSDQQQQLSARMYVHLEEGFRSEDKTYEFVGGKLEQPLGKPEEPVEREKEEEVRGQEPASSSDIVVEEEDGEEHDSGDDLVVVSSTMEDLAGPNAEPMGGKRELDEAPDENERKRARA